MVSLCGNLGRDLHAACPESGQQPDRLCVSVALGSARGQQGAARRHRLAGVAQGSHAEDHQAGGGTAGRRHLHPGLQAGDRPGAGGPLLDRGRPHRPLAGLEHLRAGGPGTDDGSRHPHCLAPESVARPE